MGYYGKLSPGCERCRKRKIKCDLRKPGCQRCEKAKTQCPGFRNLTDVSFRDESAKVIRKAQSMQTFEMMSMKIIPSHFSQPSQDVAAQFYFANFTCGEPPLSIEHRSWLLDMYYNGVAAPFRAAVEAIGMTAIANIYYAPDIASEAKRQYWRALVATNEALTDLNRSVSDETFMAVLSLGVYEFISMDSIDQFRSWATHTEGAMALLKLRGKHQFDHERGRELFVQLKQQMLYYCFQQFQSAPKILLEIHQDFEESVIGQRRKQNHPGSLSNMGFRLLDLLEARDNNYASGAKDLYFDAVRLADELEIWKQYLPQAWNYSEIDAIDDSRKVNFKGRQYVYNNPWTEQSWNTWRALRIMSNKIILEMADRCNDHDDNRLSAAKAIIRDSSTQLCISASNMMGSPRAATLIWPLMVISRDEFSAREDRTWAVQQLYRIGSTLGIRPATLLANTVSKDTIT